MTWDGAAGVGMTVMTWDDAAGVGMTVVTWDDDACVGMTVMTWDAACVGDNDNIGMMLQVWAWNVQE